MSNFKTFKFGSETAYIFKQVDGKPTMYDAKEELGLNRRNSINSYNIMLLHKIEDGRAITENTSSLKGVAAENYISLDELSNW